MGGVQDIGLVNIVTVTEENQRDHPLRFNGKCYQEFTPAFCPTVGEILKGSFQQKSYLQPNRAKVSYSCERLVVLGF